MRQIGGRFPAVILLVVILLLGGLLVSAAAPGCATGKKSDSELLQIATHELVSELRVTAAGLLAQRLQRGPLPSIGQLEELVSSPSAELRRALTGILQRAYFQALQSGQLSLQGLVAEIPQGETFELRLARAGAVIDYLLQGGFSPELASKFERLLGGGVERFNGFSLNGGLRAVRQAAYFRLWTYSYLNEWLALHPCAEWEEIATGGATEELRFLAAAAYVNNFSCILPDAETKLWELAIGGTSHELRLIAARAYVNFHQFAGLEEMIELAVQGANAELRTAIEWRLARVLATSRRFSDEQVYELAASGATAQLRQAAGWALEYRWWEKTLNGKLSISDIPRRSAAKAHSLEQALIIFATENTTAHPELAWAVIGALETIWNGWSG